MPRTFPAAIGRHPPGTALLSGKAASSPFRTEDAGIVPIGRAFAPMIRELRFAISGMAVATCLQARA